MQMNSWWVNHSQTFRHEFFGRYIWSPKRKQNDQINRFYETMREVAPSDIVYSFADGAIQGFGMARTHCYTSPRPDEFGHIGEAWNEVGWRVDVDFQRFTDPILPTQHMQAIGPTLPERYSPIRQNGYGNQGVYLAESPRPMAPRRKRVSNAKYRRESRGRPICFADQGFQSQNTDVK